MTSTPLKADDEIDAVLEQAFTDGASDTMWQNDRHVEIFAEAKRRLLADRKKHVLQSEKEMLKRVLPYLKRPGMYDLASVAKEYIERLKLIEQELEKL